MNNRLVLKFLVFVLLFLLYINYHLILDNRELKKEVDKVYQHLVQDTTKLIYTVERTNLQKLLETEQGKEILNDYRSRFFDTQIAFMRLENEISELDVLFLEIVQYQDELIEKGESSEEQKAVYKDTLHLLKLIMLDFEHEVESTELSWYEVFTEEDSPIIAIIHRRLESE